jgi:CRISP-associated protein Cas1
MHYQSSAPQGGIVIASGWGLKVYVERGHLIVHDGVGRDRHTRRLSRAYGGLKRLVVIGHSGFITLEAMRWIRDVGAAFCQIGLDGEVIAVSSADRLLDPKLRRAQALSPGSELGLRAMRELVVAKLRRQLVVVESLRGRVPDFRIGGRALATIERGAAEIARVETFREIRGRESVAGRWYWRTLAQIPIEFERAMSRRVPEHWHSGGPRTSSGSGFKGPRKANTPLHALANYAYAVLETEARIALQAYGFDPGLGIMHTDKRYRGSLAADIMEPVRPLADEVVLRLLDRPLARGDVYETRDGICRLGPSLARQVAVAAPELREALLPHAARLSNALLGRTGGEARRPRRREQGTVGKGARLRTTP